MVYVEMIEPPALTLHIQLEHYYYWWLDCCCLLECSLHFRFHRLVFHLAVDLVVVMMDSNWKNYASFYNAVLGFPILNQNVQSFFMSHQKKTIIIICL